MSTPRVTTELPGRSHELNQEFKNPIQVAERRLEQISHDAGIKVGAVVTDIKRSATDMMNNGREYVVVHPGKSIAFAATAGLLAGSLFTLVMRRGK